MTGILATSPVLVHTPPASGSGGWESEIWEVARIPKVSEHVARAGALFRVDLVIHPLYEPAQRGEEYLAELVCTPVDKRKTLENLEKSSGTSPGC